MALGATKGSAETPDGVLLAAAAVSKRFGGVRAVEEVSITV
jgi:ABC-type branched-subunit amino acid transport system ATPase component